MKFDIDGEERDFQFDLTPFNYESDNSNELNLGHIRYDDEHDSADDEGNNDDDENNNNSQINDDINTKIDIENDVTLC